MMTNRTGRIRRRRTPAQAREEILAAATELIARDGPDGVGLRQVAEAAGVSHGLVTHYFGTYASLASEVLRRANDRQAERVREQLRAEHGVPYADSLTGLLLEMVADERYVRLWAWSQLHHDEAGPRPPGTLAEIADRMEIGIRQALPDSGQPDRARIEQVILLALSAVYGYALGAPTWLAGLGRDLGPARREDFHRTLIAVLSTHLTADLAGSPPPAVDGEPKAGSGS